MSDEPGGAVRERIVIIVIRGVFVLLAVGLGLYIAQALEASDETVYLYLLVSLGLAAGVVGAEWMSARASIRTVSAIVFGIIVGTILAHLFVGLIALLGDFSGPEGREAVSYVRLSLTLVLVYFSITVILRTKDDFKFIIPYVEFQKEVQGPRPWILDTSALIDGRVVEVARTGTVDAPLLVPAFVVSELHRLADSADGTKRARGRRGLDLLDELREVEGVRVELGAEEGDEGEVDAKLVGLARRLDGKVVTTDYNLGKVAGLREVPVINLHDLATALKPQAIPGEVRPIAIEKPGEEDEQGVGYLEDGTMVVVERARAHVGEEIPVRITSSYQSNAGLMLFGRLAEDVLEESGEGSTP